MGSRAAVTSWPAVLRCPTGSSWPRAPRSALALEAKQAAGDTGGRGAVVAMPSLELFRCAELGLTVERAAARVPSVPSRRVAQGWERLVRPGGLSLRAFGASAAGAPRRWRGSRITRTRLWEAVAGSGVIARGARWAWAVWRVSGGRSGRAVRRVRYGRPLTAHLAHSSKWRAPRGPGEQTAELGDPATPTPRTPRTRAPHTFSNTSR